MLTWPDLGWLIFTFYMTIAALKTNAAVLWVFITLTATYLLLVLAEFGIDPADLKSIGGVRRHHLAPVHAVQPGSVAK